jgi:hypothetical protein
MITSNAGAQFAIKTTIIVVLGCLQQGISGFTLPQMVAAAASSRITRGRGESFAKGPHVPPVLDGVNAAYFVYPIRPGLIVI